MDISKKDAEQSLSLIEETAAQTIKSLISTNYSSIHIIWGVVWLIGFLGTHFFLKWVWPIWITLSLLGSAATFVIIRQQFRTGIPTKIPTAEKFGQRLFWFWTLLFVYVFVLISIVAPINGLQINALICSMCMFAYVVTGLWTKSGYLVWLGLAVTATTLIGYFLIPHNYYSLWMAITGGGALVGTGLYLQLRWR
jgi:hypothetical protein